MRAADKFVVYLLELLAPIGRVTARRMFGGVGLFHNGLMFGLIARDELYLKVGDANRPAFEAAGEKPFSYQTKDGTNTIQSYWRCPPDLLDDADALQDWVRRSIAAAAAAAQTNPNTKRRLTRSRSS